MKALRLIITREYTTRIKKKSFLILTILMPILFVSTFFLPLILSDIKESNAKRILVIDDTGKYFSKLTSYEDYIFENMDSLKGIEKPQIGGEILGILQIVDDLSLNPKAISLLSEKQPPKEFIDYIDYSFSEIVKKDKLENLSKSSDIDSQIITSIEQILNEKTNISVTTLRLDNNGHEKESSTMLSEILGVTFTFVMYMFILMYGAMVMNGVVEEKSNRIVEIMISAVRPFDLMMGKIIGIGLTGLTQLFIWIILGGIILAINNSFHSGGDLVLLNQQLAGLSSLSIINWLEILVYFLLFFVGGYLIYASIFAMFGASVDNAQDTQQFVMPITLIFIFALYAGIYSLKNPDGPLAFWCSMIPFTSPIVMMVRIPFGIPLWEKLLSLTILYVTIYFVVKFAARIYRIGILMYGKKNNIKEILKWISFK